jgi:WD40 repeat protein
MAEGGSPLPIRRTPEYAPTAALTTAYALIPAASKGGASSNPWSRTASPDRASRGATTEGPGDSAQSFSIGRDCNSVAISPDGRRAVVGCQDHTLQIWEIAAQVPLHILRGHKYWVNCVTYSPNGLLVASASADKTVKVWSTAEGRCESTMQGHLLSVASVAFSPDCAQIASGSWDKTVCVWRHCPAKSC